VPLGTGVAYAIKYRGGDQVCVCFMGEAAVNNGAFHESLNMAGLWRLPIIYVIENNRYGMGTAIERASSIKDMYLRGETYRIDSAVVDGQDVWEVRDAAQAAIDRARKDYAPTLLEVRTYRYMGHSMSDAVSGTYRTKDELEEYRKRDPINLCKAKLLADKAITDADVEAMEKEIAAVVQDSWDFADASPEPPLEALYEDVYVETTT
jgi:pyruvate dehydrogenase E1 component alpha subunit